MPNDFRPLRLPERFVLGGLVAVLFALLSACQGSSEPACQAGTATAPPAPAPAAGLTMKVGSYEGTGSPQCVRGVGFRPVLVIVKGDTGEFAVWRSASMEGDSTADFASGQPNFEGGIASLDPDAFSLGKHAAVNAEGTTYYYIAFADSSDIATGSYVGDGTNSRSIVGVGFQPELLFLKWDGLRSAVWSSTALPPGVSSFFDRNEDVTDFLPRFEEDGFRVRSDAWVNLDGGPQDPTTYHYVAFREVEGHLATGRYVGDGSDNSDITGVGFQPDYVWIKRGSGQSNAVHRPSSLTGDATLRFELVPNGSGEIRTLLPDGFRVGPEDTVNFEGDTYHYVAWRSAGGP